VALAVSMAVQFAAIFLEAGYWSAVGGAGPAGHVLGFNQPLMPEHIPLMAELFTASKMLPQGDEVLRFVVLKIVPILIPLLAFGQIASHPRSRSWHRWVFPQSALFSALVLLFLTFGWRQGQRWTGESIVEGELSLVMIWGCGLLASALVALGHFSRRILHRTGDGTGAVASELSSQPKYTGG